LCLNSTLFAKPGFTTKKKMLNIPPRFCIEMVEERQRAKRESRTACLGIAEGGARTLDLEVWNI
jgi:hypothetical protein